MMKKKSGKRFLSWLLAAVMIIALMPANAFAEPPTETAETQNLLLQPTVPVPRAVQMFP